MSGGRRISHDHWYCCARGIIAVCCLADGKPKSLQRYTAPRWRSPRTHFRRRYGDEEELLAIQDALLDHYLFTIGVDT